MAKFKIYNASAGAGKTYTLVKNYLKICLETDNPHRYRNILAITFTNKAANEMKDRIVKKLQGFSDLAKAKGDPMFMQLAEELGVSEERLMYSSQAALKSILHNYSSFSVSTIDKFTNRLIRSFAQDLKLSSNYEVELDNNELLSEAVDRMLADLQEDSVTSRLMLDFINDKLDEGKSPRPELSLQKMGMNLFDESAYSFIKKLKSLSRDGILEAADGLKKEKYLIVSGWKLKAESLMALIHAHHISPGDFSGGTVYRYIQTFVEGKSDKWPINKTVQDVVAGNKGFYAKGKAKEVGPKFAAIEDELLTGLRDLVDTVMDEYPRYHLIELINRESYALAVLAEIDYYLQQVKAEENKLPIGEFNKLISEKLENEPTAYLFEKLGDRYQFFFIDEFQDTSVLQWRNLLPLINNALAESGEAMIVGDAKQSIYRWRGGEVGQFIDLSNDSDPGNKIEIDGKLVELYQRRNISLGSNFRSRKEVVEFNNSFFKSAHSLLEGEDFRNIYLQSSQQVERQQGGYVLLQQIPYDKETYEEEQCNRCLEIIEDNLSRGYALRDITIITRKKDHLAIIAEVLLKNNYKVISPDSLLLQQSGEVMAIVSYLKSMCRPDDYSVRWDFLSLLWKKRQLPGLFDDRHIFMERLIKLPLPELVSELEDLIEGYESIKMLNLGLLDKVYSISRLLKLEVQQNPFLHTFIDKVSDFQNSKSGEEAAFTRFWDEKGHKQSIALPEGVDAINLMTIHRSKGLEFPVCIVPFADWMSTREPGSSESWIDLEDYDIHELPVAKVALKRSEYTFDAYRELYDRNRQYVLLDNLNLAYVAFTRAVDELYIIGSKGKNKDGENLTIYLDKFLMDNDVDSGSIEFGEKGWLEMSSKITPPKLEAYKYVGWQQRLLLSVDAPLNWKEGEMVATALGKKVHQLMADWDLYHDPNALVDAYVAKGIFAVSEVDQLQNVLKGVVNHKLLHEYFKPDIEVHNEYELILPGGKSLRPDRLVMADGKMHVLDYKTGTPHPSHHQQIREYGAVISQMNIDLGKLLLVYINDEIEIVEV